MTRPKKDTNYTFNKMYNFKLAISVKSQLLNINVFPTYSYKLKKTVNSYIRYIRLHVPRVKHILKSVVIDLFEIKKILKQRMTEYQDFEIFENIYDTIVATIVTLFKIQYKHDFISNVQLDNYINIALSK